MKSIGDLLYGMVLGAQTTTISKKDIPEVESAITVMNKLAQRHWDRVVASTLRSLEDSLDRIPSKAGIIDVAPVADANDRDEALENLVLALLLLIETGVSTPLGAAESAIVRDVSEKLLVAGGRNVGLQFNGASTRGSQALMAAEIDFKSIFVDHFIRAKDAVRMELEFFLTSKAARTPSTLTSEAVQRASGQGGLVTRQGWLERLRKALDAAGTGFVRVSVDAWAYRWYGIGAFEAGVQAGARSFELFNNPPLGPDAKTSKICQYMHGKRIRMEAARRQIEQFRRARITGDGAGAMRAWPYVRSDSTSPEQLALHLARYPLPPFHGRCRTYLRPIFN